MNVGVDAMGGDFAPYEVVKGVLQYVAQDDDTNIYLYGDETKIRQCFSQLSKEIPKQIILIHTNSFVTMEDDPMVVMKEKSDSSMAIGLNDLKEGKIDGFLSAGSTGALHTASTLIVRKIKGIRRTAIATVLPFEHPVLLMDCGANPEVTPDILNQWSILGSCYMQGLFHLLKPTVGLLNNGTEEHKGTLLQREAYVLLRENSKIQFAGNVESKEIPSHPCDVIVTDGFSGNIALKTLEGMSKFFLSNIKNIFKTNFRTKIGYLFVKKELLRFRQSFNTSEYGASMFLGLQKPVLKAHGNSKAKEIFCGIAQTVQSIRSNTISEVTKQFEERS